MNGIKKNESPQGGNLEGILKHNPSGQPTRSPNGMVKLNCTIPLGGFQAWKGWYKL
jgi:hypothetical protein